MENKMVKVPFEVELAKKITNGEVEGRVVTREGDSVRILCWDKKDKTYNLAALVDDGIEENYRSYTNEGIWNTDETCTLKKYDLMLEIPEYMTFKDGDIIAFNECETVLIVKGTAYKNGIGTLYCDCYAVVVNGYLYVDSNVIINRSRFATETEKQKLITALKESKEPKAKEYLKRFFGIEQKQEHEFKPFDRVICRDDYSEWFVDMFSHIDGNGSFACIGSVWKYCLPYNDQTAHLLGTDKDWEE